MIYLASPCTRALYEHALTGRVGVLVHPKAPHPVDELSAITWAADNECYGAGAKFDLSAYLRFLERHAAAADSCLFAAAPDVHGDPVATWERSAPVLEEIRARGYKAALCAQDEFDADAVDWTAFDVLFVGGRDPWHLEGGYDLATIAAARGKGSHMGRVNSYQRAHHARAAGFDSSDGSFLSRAPDGNLPRLLHWLDKLDARPDLLTGAR